MDRIISSWFNVIQNGLLQNTYKLAWAKAIIECCRDGEGTNTYSFDDISLKMFGYYWNQTIHHNFKQSLNPNKPPVFLSYVNDKISDYQEQKGYRPIDFVKVRDSISFNFEFMISILKRDVIHRFSVVQETKYHLYELDFTNDKIRVFDSAILGQYSEILNELIYFRWAQFLETCNSIQDISKKLKITDGKNKK